MRLKTLLLTTVAVAIATPVAAQSVAIEEIIVTVRKREESLQDVPLSVTVFSAELIERAGIARIDDIARLTPSLVFEQNFSAQDTRPIIRGLPATRGRPPIGVLIDGVDVSSEAVATAGGGNLLNLRLIDVDRIEVVKGPQSALYGRVAFGGAINYVTKRPGDEVSGKLNVTAASHGTYEVVGAVEGPVVDEAMSIRLHAGYSRSAGYHENTVSDKNIGGYESAQGQSDGFSSSDRKFYGGCVSHLQRKRYGATTVRCHWHCERYVCTGCATVQCCRPDSWQFDATRLNFGSTKGRAPPESNG